MKASLWCLLAALLVGLPVPGATGAIQSVTIANDMNSAGRKLQHPTPEHPAYYVGVFRGYLDRGKQWGNGDPQKAFIPTPGTVTELVAKTLAEQGYLPAVQDLPADPHSGPNAPHRQVMAGAPSLILNVQSGYLSNRTLKIPTYFQTVEQPGGGPLVGMAGCQ